MECPCANDSSGPLLIDGRSQTAKSGFVDDAEPAISGCISIIGRRAASRSGHAPKRPPGFAQIPRRCPTSEVARGRHRRDQSSQSRRCEEERRCPSGGWDQSVPVSDKTTRAVDEIQEGKANLIRASFRAGIKPVAIARTFRISQSLVSRVLNSTEKPKR
jgi:hypothetical protein